MVVCTAEHKKETGTNHKNAAPPPTMNTPGVATTPGSTMAGGGDNNNRPPSEDPYIANDFHPLSLAANEILSALRDDESAPDADLYRRIISSSSAASHRYHVVDGDGIGSMSKTSGAGSGSPSSQGSDTAGGQATNSENSRNQQQSPRSGIGSPFGTGPFRGSGQQGGSPNTPSQSEDRSTDVSSKTFVASPPTSFLQHDRSTPLPTTLANEAKKAKSTTLMGIFPEANLVWLSADEKLFLWSYKSDDGDLDRPLSWGAVPSSALDNREDFCSFSVPSGQCILSVGIVCPKKGA